MSRACLSRGVSWGVSAARAVRPARMTARTRRGARMPLPGNCKRISKFTELPTGSFCLVSKFTELSLLFSFSPLLPAYLPLTTFFLFRGCLPFVVTCLFQLNLIPFRLLYLFFFRCSTLSISMYTCVSETEKISARIPVESTSITNFGQKASPVRGQAEHYRDVQ